MGLVVQTSVHCYSQLVVDAFWDVKPVQLVMQQECFVWHGVVMGIRFIIKRLQVQLVTVSLCCNDLASCSHTRASATKEYNLVLAKGR